MEKLILTIESNDNILKIFNSFKNNITISDKSLEKINYVFK